MFSEKGWNLEGRKIEIYNSHSNKDIAGKSGIIKKVKSEIATIDLDGIEADVPFSEIYQNKDAKIFRD